MFSYVYPYVASVAASCDPSPGSGGISSLILPTWYKYIPGKLDNTGRCGLDFAFPDDIGAILLAVIEILLRVGTLVAIGYIIYGGFLFLTSQGEPDRAKSAQQAITNAIIGLVVTLVAAGVVSFIGNQLIK